MTATSHLVGGVASEPDAPRLWRLHYGSAARCLTLVDLVLSWEVLPLLPDIAAYVAVHRSG